jgi:hypothetical protein
LERSGGSWSADLSQVVRNFEGLAEFGVRKELFGEGVPIEPLRVHCASEQQPNPLCSNLRCPWTVGKACLLALPVVESTQSSLARTILTDVKLARRNHSPSDVFA